MAKKISWLIELNWEKRILMKNLLFLLILFLMKIKIIIYLLKLKKFISNYKCELNDRNLEIIFFEKFKNINFLTT